MGASGGRRGRRWQQLWRGEVRSDVKRWEGRE